MFNSFTDLLLTVCLKAPILLFLSTLTLSNFKAFIQFLTVIQSKKTRGTFINNSIGEYIRPGLKLLNQYLIEVLGPLDSIKFNINHIILGAILLAIIMKRPQFKSVQNWQPRTNVQQQPQPQPAHQ